MKRTIARTWVQYDDSERGGTHTGVLITHTKPDMDATKRQFTKMAKIYNGMYHHRVWTTLESTGEILFDTNRGDWIPYEVRRVQKSKHPHLLIGRIKTEAGLKALEQKLKGDDQA